jgi:formylglycine-generating enzyme required for sulfatase activity
MKGGSFILVLCVLGAIAFAQNRPVTDDPLAGVLKRDMVLATPDETDLITITGDTAYEAGSYNGDAFFPAGRTVKLSPFRIAKYETTYELWYAVKVWATSSERGANLYTFANPGREGSDGTDGAAPTGDKYEPVMEWCWDWRDSVSSGETVTDPTGAASGSLRVLRGGSWGDSASFCTVAIRNSGYPYHRYNIFGFRFVCP